MLRRAMRLRQEEFALKVGISRTYLSQIETGRDPSAALRDRIVDLEKQWKQAPIESQSSETPTESEFIPTESELESSVQESSRESEDSMGGGRARLKALRLKAGHEDQAKFARLVGYSPLIYRGIEDGSSNMSQKMAVKVAKELGCTVEDLLGGGDHPPSKGVHHGTVGVTPDIHLPTGQKARFVPLISMGQCGAMEHGSMVAFDDGGYVHEGFLAFNPSDPQTFAVTLAGDSMTPVCSPGDVAVIYPTKKPLHNGSIVLAKLGNKHGDGVMLKLFQQSGDQVTLSSYNPAYPPVTWHVQDFVWIYHVASVTKVFP